MSASRLEAFFKSHHFLPCLVVCMYYFLFRMDLLKNLFSLLSKKSYKEKISVAVFLLVCNRMQIPTLINSRK